MEKARVGCQKVGGFFRAIRSPRPSLSGSSRFPLLCLHLTSVMRENPTNTQDFILGNFQPSLAGLHLPALHFPGLASWAIFRPSLAGLLLSWATISRRCGTD